MREEKVLRSPENESRQVFMALGWMPAPFETADGSWLALVAVFATAGHYAITRAIAAALSAGDISTNWKVEASTPKYSISRSIL